MKPPRDWLIRLKQELARWVEQGLVTPEQQEKILGLYPEPEAAAGKQRRVTALLPAILIGMAVLLIAVGLSLFYAANWRKMAPTLKLVQILGVLVLVHGGAVLLLFGRRRVPIAGRGLLVLAMLVFGAAIGLVAQTYHISAHPSDGVLLWLLGVLALSAVMRERIGYYLALGLALLWHCWEFAIYDNPNLWLPLVLAALGWLLYRAEDAVGLLLDGVLLLVWGYTVNAWVLKHGELQGVMPLLLSQVPLGVCLVAFQRLRKPALLRLLAEAAGGVGWVLVFAPLIGLSWPMRLGDAGFPFWTADVRPILAQHVALGVAGALLLSRLRRQGEAGVPFLAAVLGVGLLALVLPLGRKAPLLVYTHLSLVGFLLGLLFDSYRQTDGRSAQRVLALVLVIATLFAKAGGFALMGVIQSSSYWLAYLMGAVILALLLLLINRALPVLLARLPSPSPYPQKLLDGLCALVVFLLLYGASFRLPQQSSIFSADAVVLVLLGLFILLCLALYAFLWRRSAERLPLLLSAVVFAAALAMLLISRPATPWQLYSVIFNLLLLVVQGLLLLHATRANSIVLANLVIAAFGVQLATRYFDIFWDLLSGSLLFIVTGLVVFVGGFLLELNRRRLVRSIREAHR